MDLRKYANKRINIKALQSYKYIADTWYGKQYRDYSVYFIEVFKGDEKPDNPSYSLYVQVDKNQKITHIGRLIKIYGAGSSIKSFPEEVLLTAEKCLCDITAPEKCQQRNIEDGEVITDKRK